MGIRQEKNRLALEYVRKLIANLNAGEALPPMRQMIQESGFGRGVLENTIQLLAEEQLLVIRERSGIYVNEQGPREHANVIDIIACSEIAYLGPDNSSAFTMALVAKLLEGATQHQMLPRIHRISYYASVLSYQELIQREKINNAFLLMPHHNDIARTFEFAGIPHVVLFPRYYPNYGPAVIDAPELVDMQVKYLVDMGHRRIGFIHSVDLGMMCISALLRRESFYRVMGENGIAVRPEWVMHYSLNREQMFERLDRMFNSPEAPTALVISDWFLLDVYAYMAARNRKIGEDISVISCDGMDFQGLSPEPATVVNSPVKAGALAWELFDKRSEDVRFQSIDYIDLELQKGKSIVRLK